MSDEMNNPEELAGALQLLQELELNKSEDVRKQRTHVRRQISIDMIAKPGNTSDHAKGDLTGKTADISEGGCQAVMTLPCLVGDIYRLEFGKNGVGLPEVFARTLRCRMIREDAFEVGFCFLTRIVLPASL